MRHRLKALLLGLSLVPLAGCGTVVARMDDKIHWTDDAYFKSTQANVKLLVGEVDTGYFPATAFCWMSIACPVVSILTLPVDAVVDVVALPHDYYADHLQ